MDLRRGPCDIPSGRVEYRKAVLTSKWYLLSVEADWREATAGALAGGRLAAEELVHRAMPPERIGAARDRTQGGCGEGVGSCEQFRKAEGDGVGLWPRSIGAFDTLGGFGATFPPSSKGKSAKNSGEPRWPTCQRVTTSSSRSPTSLAGKLPASDQPCATRGAGRVRRWERAQTLASAGMSACDGF